MERPLSRVEDIIDLDYPYTGPILSRIEALFNEKFWGVTYSGPLMSRIERLIRGDRSFNPISEIEKILYYGKDYKGPITCRVSKLLMDAIEPEDWTYEAILDNFGRPLLDSDGDKILGRYKFTTSTFSDSYGTNVLDNQGDTVLGRVLI